MKLRKLSAILLAGALMATPAVMPTVMAESSQTAEKDEKGNIVDPSGYLEIEETVVTGVTEKGKAAKEIVVPEGVTSINSYAASDCTNLTDVTIPKSVTYIHPAAFKGCTSLVNINVSEDNETYSSVDGLLFSKDKTKFIIYPAGKKDKTYSVPEGVVLYYIDVFNDAVELEKVTFPSSVEGFSTDYKTAAYDSFGYNTNLKSIEVSENNKNIYSVDGVLFGDLKIKDYEFDEDFGNFGSSKTLIRYPIGNQQTSYSIPDGIENIGPRAFYGCKNLKSITIPHGLKNIDVAAFYNCTSLETLFIPDTVEELGSYEFYGCTSLKDVYFEGSKEQFLEIVYDEDLTNVFGNATIHYNYVASTNPDTSTDSNTSDSETSSDTETSSDSETSSENSTTDSTDSETSSDNSTAESKPTDSTTDSNSSNSGSTTTPDTGVAGLSLTIGVIALAGAAVVISRKKR